MKIVLHPLLVEVGVNINEIEKFLNVHIDIVAKDSESTIISNK